MSEQIPAGVWPVMLTAFKQDKAIDWAGMDALTDWYIAEGSAGLFAVCGSSEMYHLTPEERLALAEHVVKRAAGRVPVIASGTFGGPIAEQAAFVQKMAGTGVQAVVVLTNQIAAQDEDDDQWLKNAESLLSLTGSIPLGLYECPSPYRRTLSPELTRWAAETGRFLFMKQTSAVLDEVRAKCEAAAGTPLRVFNAEATTLLDSLRAGGSGYSGIAANFYPALLARFCAQHQSEDAAHLQALLNVLNVVVHTKYLPSAKCFLKLRGLPIETVSRSTDETLDEYDMRILRGLLRVLESDQLLP
jgi:4-hydroxy-tetrahydrodipicolinate synthase